VFLTLIALLYGFLVAPIVIVVAASLNAGGFSSFRRGLSLQWYAKLLNSEPFVGRSSSASAGCAHDHHHNDHRNAAALYVSATPAKDGLRMLWWHRCSFRGS